MAPERALSNLDMLAWFREDERSLCKSCGQRAAVTLPEVETSFCLGCGAVTVDGVRIDRDLRIAGPSEPLDVEAPSRTRASA